MRSADDRPANVGQQVNAFTSCSQGGDFACEPREQLFMSWELAPNRDAVLVPLDGDTDLPMGQFKRPIAELFTGDAPDASMREMLPFAAGISLRIAVISIVHLVTSTCQTKRFCFSNIGSPGSNSRPFLSPIEHGRLSRPGIMTTMGVDNC